MQAMIEAPPPLLETQKKTFESKKTSINKGCECALVAPISYRNLRRTSIGFLLLPVQ